MYDTRYSRDSQELKALRQQKINACVTELKASLKAQKKTPVLPDSPIWGDNQPSEKREKHASSFAMSLHPAAVVTAGREWAGRAVNGVKQFPTYMAKQLPAVGPAVQGAIARAWASNRGSPVQIPRRIPI